ncbi:hypothetical protein BGX26_006991 [Mortierella sp. AD094]|nr:hypothetical protein BGX26_006991 [Mortierella sp. AD094]
MGLSAFAVVNIIKESHWGALCIDFQNHSIQYGHSLDNGYPQLPRDVLHTLRHWLLNIGIIGKDKDDDWPKMAVHVEQLQVQNQPYNSGSCVIVSVNTIECNINPDHEHWSHERSAFHRLRLVKILTGYTKGVYSSHSIRFLPDSNSIGVEWARTRFELEWKCRFELDSIGLE